MEHLYGSNSYFQQANKHRNHHLSVKEIQQLRHLSSSALSPLIFS